jgi:BlaI family transcriptional regulator, penicillinase repressor
MDVRFTDRELDIMEVLWSRGASTVAEVQEALDDELAYNTVLTMLGVLEDKQRVTRAKEGRAHRYAASVPKEMASRSALNRVTDRLFEGSPEAVLLQLVDQGSLGEDELRRMRDLLDSRLDGQEEDR